METKIPGVKLGGAQNGTSLRGYVTTSYAKLVGLLGEPNGQTDDYKVSTEWVVTYRGESYTIYDYKETNLYDEGAPTVEEFRAQSSYEWHIGGAHEASAFLQVLARATEGTFRAGW